MALNASVMEQIGLLVFKAFVVQSVIGGGKSDLVFRRIS